MSNYKQFIQGTGLPEKKENANQNPINEENLKIIEEVEKFIKKLSQDEILSTRRSDTFNNFKQLEEPFKMEAYKKIYNTISKYKEKNNDPNIQNIMQTSILNTINSYYSKQIRVTHQKNNKICALNNHIFPEKWACNNGMWVRKCTVCGYPEKRFDNPYEKGKSRTRKN